MDRSITFQLGVEANSDPNTTNVTIVGEPTIEQSWNGVWVFPRDADDFAIDVATTREDFEVSLNRGDSKAICDSKKFSAGMYKLGCVVHEGLPAGKWDLNVTLGRTLFFTTAVQVNCANGRFMEYDHSRGQHICSDCRDVSGVDVGLCLAGTSLATLPIRAGFWRHDQNSKDVYACRFGSRSCPGSGTSSTNCRVKGTGPVLSLMTMSQDSTLCACGYVGALCSECDSNHVLGWTGNSCEECGRGGTHVPWVTCAVFVLITVVGGIGGFITCTRRREIYTMPRGVKYLKRLYSIGRVKFTSILFYTAQVIAQIAVVSEMNGGSEYSGPATAFVGGLNVMNFDLMSYLPLSCVFPQYNAFYMKLLLQTIGPLVLVACLWLMPLLVFRRDHPQHDVVTNAVATLSILIPIVLLPSASTTIVSSRRLG